MPNQNIKILFFGTSAFAVPILQKLIDAKYNISAVVTQPDKPVGRKQILTPSPVKILAQKNNLSVLQPVSLSTPLEIQFPNLKSKIKNLKLIITASYGKIIPKNILDSAKYRALNVHPSLLPKYRGTSPIQYAILNGDKETGVTIMLMDEKMDHGQILAQEKLNLIEDDPAVLRGRLLKISYPALHDALANMGAELLIKTITKWISCEIKPTPQDDAQATYTKIIKKEDGKIDWKKATIEIDRQIRAFTPWPGCWTIFKIGGKGKRVKILEATCSEGAMSTSRFQAGNIPVSPESPERDSGGKAFCRRSPLRETAAGQKDGAPGQIITTQTKKMTVACGAGYLEILKLQPEGKKEMSGEEFLRGYGDVEKVMLQ